MFKFKKRRLKLIKNILNSKIGLFIGLEIITMIIIIILEFKDIN